MEPQTTVLTFLFCQQVASSLFYVVFNVINIVNIFLYKERRKTREIEVKKLKGVMKRRYVVFHILTALLKTYNSAASELASFLTRSQSPTKLKNNFSVTHFASLMMGIAFV